jgi:hypothetical protein
VKESSTEDSLQRVIAATSTTTDNLGLFNRTYHDHKMLDKKLLLRGPGAMDRRLDVGHVVSHITNETIQLRRLDRPDHQDPLQLDIWARPIGYMQR